MTIFGRRCTPREWSARLAGHLMDASGVDDVRIDAPLRLHVWYAGRGPFDVDASGSYAAYQRASADDTRLIAVTAASMLDAFAHLDDPPTWEAARPSVVPWPIRPTDTHDRAIGGYLGDLAIAFAFSAPISAVRTLVSPLTWGVDQETLRARALANLARLARPPTLSPLPDNPAILRLLPRDPLTASRVLLPAVQQAIFTQIGSPAVFLIAARDTVFVCAPNILGDPPPSLRPLAMRILANDAEPLSDQPIILSDRRFASR